MSGHFALTLCLVSAPGSMEVFPHIDLKEGKIEGQPRGSALLNIAKLRVICLST